MKILLGVTGGIAAYKSCALVSLAAKRGHEVRVVMTENATRFVGTATFEALSGHGVMLDTFGDGDTAGIDHIEWAKWCDVMLIAPLTANTLGKLACGLADDALSTVAMALPRGRPALLAPAMNTEMWEHPVVQRNLKWLGELGRYEVIQPISKRLACGVDGMGGMEEPPAILAALERAVEGQ